MHRLHNAAEVSLLTRVSDSAEETVAALAQLRRHRAKFHCIQTESAGGLSAGTATLLREALETLFPEPSSFER